jgi:hypothetical protein
MSTNANPKLDIVSMTSVTSAEQTIAPSVACSEDTGHTAESVMPQLSNLNITKGDQAQSSYA